MCNREHQRHNLLHGMAAKFINTKRLYENTKKTLTSQYIDSVEQNVEDTFAQNVFITEAIALKMNLNKSSFLIKHLYTRAIHFAQSKPVQNCFQEFGKTFPFVEKCIEDMISKTQIKIYSLQDKFNNHAFRDEHMIENKGIDHEYYYDYNSEINNWRELIDEEIYIITDEFMKDLLEMNYKTKIMNGKNFILSPLNSKYFDEKAKIRALKQIHEYPKKKTSEDSKKRKLRD